MKIYRAAITSQEPGEMVSIVREACGYDPKVLMAWLRQASADITPLDRWASVKYNDLSDAGQTSLEGVFYEAYCYEIEFVC